MINKTQYIRIADYVSNIQQFGGLALGPLLDVKETLQTADINPRDRFRREFYAALNATYYYISSAYAVPNGPMREFVRALNQHVLDFYGTATIDEFLVDNNIRVPQTFADISTYVGFPITEVLEDSPENWEMFDVNWEDVDEFWDMV